MKLSVVVAARSVSYYESVRKNIASVRREDFILVEGSNPSVQRNEGVRSAAGDIIYFADDDTIPSPGAAGKAIEIFEKEADTAVVGGPCVTPETDSLLQKIFGAVFSSVFASGKSASRYAPRGMRRETDEKELILCNLFVRKDVFEKTGGFREDLYPNEENEFLNRVKKGGYKIIYDPDICAKRSQREGIFEFLKQCFRYGRGRAEQIKVAGAFSDLVNAVPAVFLLYLLLAPFLKGVPFIFAPAAVYAASAVVFSAAAALKAKNPVFFIGTMAVFPLLHIYYGAGFITGLVFSDISVRKINRDVVIKKEGVK